MKLDSTKTDHKSFIKDVYPFNLSVSDHKPANEKSVTYGYVTLEIRDEKYLIEIANQMAISPSFYRNIDDENRTNGYSIPSGGHRRNDNIVKGGNILLIDCDGFMEDSTPQYKVIEQKIKKYHYIKVPSASGKEHKWHYLIPTKRTRSMCPQKFKWETETFFEEVGIAVNDIGRGKSSMCDLQVSLQASRALAPATAKKILTAKEANNRSVIHRGEILDLQDAPEDISTVVSSTKAAIAKRTKVYEPTEELPTDSIWFDGNPMSYLDTYNLIKEQAGSGTLSGFGCPFDNHSHRGDRTKGYGVAYLYNGEIPTIKCMGNSCSQPYFVIPESVRQIDTEVIEIDMVEKPVHHIEFEQKLTETLLDLTGGKFFISDKMIDVFHEYTSTFNRATLENKSGEEPKRHIIPLTTGSAKTTAMKLYSAMTDEACLLIVRKAMTAVEIVRHINELAKDDIARTYYSIDAHDGRPDTAERVNKNGLKNYRVIVLTHKMFQIMNQTPGSKAFDNYATYQDKRRNTIVIDERIDLTQMESFTNEEVNEAIESLKKAVDESMNNIIEAIKKLEELNDIVFTYKREKMIDKNKFGLYSVNECSAIGEYTQIIDTILEEMETKRLMVIQISTLRKNKKSETEIYRQHYAIVDLLHRIKFVMENKPMLLQTGKFTTISAVKDLSLAFGSTVILDATADVSRVYDSYAFHQNQSTMIYTKTPIRRYENTTFHIARGYGQSKTRLYSKTYKGSTVQKSKDEILKQVKAYLQVLAKNVEPGDHMLVAVHKDVINIFRENNIHKNIEFINWGQHAGSNQWSHFNKAAVVGWYRVAQHIYANQLFAGAKDYHNYQPTTSYNTDVKELENSSIVEDMVQFFNRIRCRVPIDKDGNHEPVDIYLFSGDKDNDDDIVADVIEQFPGCKTTGWTIDGTIQPDIKKRTKIEERIDRIIHELKQQREKYDDILVKSIRDKLGMTTSVFSRIMRNDYFKQMLGENNIIIENIPRSHGRKKRFRFE